VLVGQKGIKGFSPYEEVCLLMIVVKIQMDALIVICSLAID
jgi:hypothetical protein